MRAESNSALGADSPPAYAPPGAPHPHPRLKRKRWILKRTQKGSAGCRGHGVAAARTADLDYVVFVAPAQITWSLPPTQLLLGLVGHHGRAPWRVPDHVDLHGRDIGSELTDCRLGGFGEVGM